jgi:hypothetical protein
MSTIRPQLPTLDDIKRLAVEMGVTFTSHRDSFDLDKQEPWLAGTYRNTQAGINAAFNVLVRHGRLLQYPSTRLSIAEEYIRENNGLYRHYMISEVQRNVSRGTGVDLTGQEAITIVRKICSALHLGPIAEYNLVTAENWPRQRKKKFLRLL